MVDGSQEMNSCPLFGNEMQTSDHDGAIAPENDLHNHWLFVKKSNSGNDDSNAKSKEEADSLQRLETEFHNFISKVKKQRKEISKLQNFETVDADNSVLSNDNAKYLFKDDTVIYKRHMNLNSFNLKALQNVKILSDHGGHPRNRLHLSRKAKSKEINAAVNVGEIIDDEIEDVDRNVFTTTAKRSCNEEKSFHITRPLKRSRNAKLEKELVNLSSSDEEEKNDKNSPENSNQDSESPKKPGAVATIVNVASSLIKQFTSSKKPVENKQGNVKPMRKEQVQCPMCNKMFSQAEINNHAFDCQGPVESRVTRGSNKTSKNVSSYAPWASACHSFDVKVKEETNSEENGILMDVDKHPYSTAKKDFDNKSVNAYFTKRKEKRSKGYSISSDSDGDLFDGYLQNTNSKKATITYTRTNGRINFLNESQDDGFIKCVKCEQRISEEDYQKHTEQCLEDSVISVQVSLSK